jgi:maltooligosyltrehalose trehalohydrolase
MDYRSWIGPAKHKEGWRFSVWAPEAKTVELLLPQRKVALPLKRSADDVFEGFVPELRPGTRYLYRLEGKGEFPDPASRFQPGGVHKASAIVDPDFRWTDQGWFGLPIRDYVIYELHIGTFTPEGTFEAVIPHLRRLRELGITCIEIMPIAQFPGDRNWGYDGVYPYAAQNSYGGPEGLKKLVNAAHREGLAVCLDVVYNHLGPEGNYFGNFGPYFTSKYATPWGKAMNVDGPGSDQVRRYFIQNALYWQTECHIDALRLDAVHAILDVSAVTFLQELAQSTHRQSERLNRRFHLIAESDLNDPRLILPPIAGGFGLHAQWSDDFHHSLRVLLTGEKTGYYSDYGGTELFARVLREGYAYINSYSEHRKRRHGNSPRLTHAKQFVVYSGNHDQVGNRMAGDRLSAAVSLEELKLAASAVLLSPFVPMLFMGEEYGEKAPFQYFTSHSDPGLIEAVREGRKREFAAFHTGHDVPDPHDPATFERSKLDHALRERGEHRQLYDFYRELLRLRRESLPLDEAEKETMNVIELPARNCVCLHYWTDDEHLFVVFCFAKKSATVEVPLPPGDWRRILDTSETKWGGPTPPATDPIRSKGVVKLKLAPTSCLAFSPAAHR